MSARLEEWWSTRVSDVMEKPLDWLTEKISSATPIGPATRTPPCFCRRLTTSLSISPWKFDGEADLKHVYDNIYVGG